MKPAVVMFSAGMAVICLSVAGWIARPRQTVDAMDEMASAWTPMKVSRGPVAPIPLEHDQDPARVALGARLFQDPRLSADGSVSCASCHDLALRASTARFATGIGGQRTRRNAPTIWNTRYHSSLFWDGRANDLEAQIDHPLLSPEEMGNSWERLLRVIGQDPAYARDFAAAYDDGVTAHNVRDAIATFERSLTTPNAPFDRWLAGDAAAIDAKALHGYELFLEHGCVACHQGIAVGGNMFQKLGIMRELDAQAPFSTTDIGRAAVTGRPADRFYFKVPSLRNVARTAPYFHDGSVATLADAVRVMGRYQLDIELSDPDVEAIVAFLESLNGEVQWPR